MIQNTLKIRIKGRCQSLSSEAVLSSIQTLEFDVRHLHIFINWLHSSIMMLHGCSRGSGALVVVEGSGGSGGRERGSLAIGLVKLA